MSERFHNQRGIIAPELIASKSFLIVGAGAIGSFVAVTLAKMGAKNITVYDDDKIEEHNISNQLYPMMSVDSLKVDSLSRMVREFSGENILTAIVKFKEDCSTEYDFVISAVDNMDVRKMIFDKCLADGKARWFIDGRMGALILRAYSVDLQNKDEVEFYKKTLYPQSQAAPERCTQKSIIYTVLLVAGQMLNMIKKRINNENCPTEIYMDNNNLTFVSSKAEPQEVENEAELVEA